MPQNLGRAKNKKIAAQTVTGLCRKYSVPATRELVNRVLSGTMSDADLIKAVVVINDRAHGKVSTPMEHNVTVDLNLDHLEALKSFATKRIAERPPEDPEVIDITPERARL
jgi:hypothetical protein